MQSFIKWLYSLINQKIGLKSRSQMRFRTDWLISCCCELLWTASIRVQSYVQSVFIIAYYCCSKFVELKKKKFLVRSFFFISFLCVHGRCGSPVFRSKIFLVRDKSTWRNHCLFIIHYQWFNIPTLVCNVTTWLNEKERLMFVVIRKRSRHIKTFNPIFWSSTTKRKR